MNKKMSKRQRDIKTKLIAAICMLLVSSIMMVSTTYAWFTLSTAPEVTGIQTAVGANGNLEMALLNPDLQENGAMKSNWGELIESGTHDSMDAQAVDLANITWGNLVDVSDNGIYGLQNITLYPAALTGRAVDGVAAVDPQAPLQRPVYGADGRVAELKNDTLTASYISSKFSNEGALGVRAIGTASSMTERESEHRNLLTLASDATEAAKGHARSSLLANGDKLAAMAITHVGDETATFVKADMEALGSVLTELSNAYADIETAMMYYVIAYNITPASVDDTSYKTIKSAIEAMTLEAIYAWTDASEYEKPEGFDAAYTKLTSSKAEITAARNTLSSTMESVGDGAYSWAQISSVMSKIMDFDKMKLCDLSMAQVKEKDDAGNYKNLVQIGTAASNGGLKLQMPTGSGVFADIADFCGTYSASIVFPENTSVMSFPIGGMTATMTTDAPINPTYLSAIRGASDDIVVGEGGASSKAITDYYGYIIDLAFRTNAGGSNLLLQADGIDRIYGEEGKNEELMGGGSTMTFTATTNFGASKVQSLMTSLRIVFFETDTSKILGYARLNPATVIVEGDNVTMKMGMWDTDAEAFKTGDAKTANVITALNQNEAKAVSVLVYLDGTSVTNADVATEGTRSTTGTMNLQFASSAELTPMDYSDLKEGTSNATVVTPTPKDYADGEVTVTGEGYTASNVKYATYSGTQGFAAVISKDSTAVTEGITVMIDGVAATYAEGVWVAPTSKTTAPDTVTIVVTPVNP